MAEFRNSLCLLCLKVKKPLRPRAQSSTVACWQGAEKARSGSHKLEVKQVFRPDEVFSFRK
jgi:hypothetical protein